MFTQIERGIDALNDWQGRITSMLIIPLLLVVIYEVFMRYAINKPTIWGFEATAFLYGLHYMFGLAYADRHGTHVKVDIMTARFPARVQAVFSVVTTLVFFLPVIFFLTVSSFQYAATSIAGREVNSTSWAPPVYPFKLLMAITLLLLLLQGISNLIKDFKILLNQAPAASES
jgi:TRAP-type mannitol/chloroaromatic compound transport system permease small subunit